MSSWNSFALGGDLAGRPAIRLSVSQLLGHPPPLIKNIKLLFSLVKVGDLINPGYLWAIYVRRSNADLIYELKTLLRFALD